MNATIFTTFEGELDFRNDGSSLPKNAIPCAMLVEHGITLNCEIDLVIMGSPDATNESILTYARRALGFPASAQHYDDARSGRVHIFRVVPESIEIEEARRQVALQEDYIESLKSGTPAESHVIIAAYDILTQLEEKLEWLLLTPEQRLARNCAAAAERAWNAPILEAKRRAIAARTNWDDDEDEPAELLLGAATLAKLRKNPFDA